MTGNGLRSGSMAAACGNPTLRVRLLGGVDLRLGEQRLQPLDSGRAESLLAYLLLHREMPQQRGHVAFMLWPDSTEAQARTNLRHVLHNLRRALPESHRFVDARARTLQWRSDAPLWLDVATFEQALEEGRLEDAVEAYKGELLEGNLDEWLREERERLSQLQLGALDRLARDLQAQGRFGEAIGYAERLLRQQPLREETYRLLIDLYDMSGDRAAALRTYHACATTLVRELGVEPSAVTRRAYDALLGAPHEPGAGLAVASAARPQLVGRRAERRRLTQLWREAERGRAQLVLVTGEAGIGKSRLVEELRSWSADRGAVVAESRSYPAEGTMAYGALVDWLRSEPIATRLRRLPSVDLIELTRLLPELVSEFPQLAAAERLPEDEHRRRLFAVAARAMLIAGAPLLLVVDDLQSCDVQTLQFVHYLLRVEPRGHLLVAATARLEELEAHRPVRELVAALRALDVVSEVGLERLSRPETALLAGRITGRQPADDEAERLHQDSEGVPLFVVEALRAGPDAAARAIETTERVRAVIASRLALLSEQAAELAGVAATIGREFTVQVLADASRASEEALVRGLDELWRRAIVRARDASSYDFSHGKVREAAYAALSPAAARHHHLRVAEALQRSPADTLDAASGQIAAHYEAAGATDDAIAWHMRAADTAQRLHASADAVGFLERARRLVSELPAGAERDALELRVLSELPTPLLAVEGYLSGRVAEVHERALERARSLGVDLDAPLIRSLALGSLARGEFEAGREFGDQLRMRGESERDGVLRVEGGYVLGIAAYWQGRLAAARSHFADTVERCRPEQRSAHLIRYGQDPEIVCLTRLAHTLWLLGEERDAERTRDRALALADERGHAYSRAVAAVFAGMLALDQGDEQRLRRQADRLRSGDPAYRAPQIAIVAGLFAGLLEVRSAEASRGIGHVRQTVVGARRLQPATPGFHALLTRILLEACAAADDAEAGLAAADEALEMGGGTELWEAEIRRLRAEFLTSLDADPHAIEAELRRAIEVAVEQGARAFEVRARASLERLLAATR